MSIQELQNRDFRCYITAAGFNVEANAKQFGETVNIQWIQIGSGELPDGQSPVNRTSMVNSYGTAGRFPAKVYTDPVNPGGFVAECTITGDHAINGQGYVINEAAAVLDNGVLYAYRRVASDYKPVNQGEVKSYIIRLRFVPANAEVINITVDPTVVYATHDDVIREIGEHSDPVKSPDPHPQYQQKLSNGILVGNQMIGVLSFEHETTPANGEYVLCKTNAAYGQTRHFMLEILCGFGSYTFPVTATLGFYFYNGNFHNPAVIVTGFQQVPEILIGNDNGYYAIAIKTSYYQNVSMNLQTRRQGAGAFSPQELSGWTARLVTPDVVSTFIKPPVIRSYSEAFPPPISKVSDAQFAPYNSQRIYKPYETCTSLVDGRLRVWEAYHNQPFSNKSPDDIANRHDGWGDITRPFYWIPYTGGRVGMPFFWLDTKPPEEAVMELNIDLPVAVYWRLAETYPHLVNGDVINTGEIRGDVLRVLDQGRGVDPNRQLGSFQDSTRIPYMSVNKTGSTGRIVTPPMNSYPDGTIEIENGENIISGSGLYMTTNLAPGGNVSQASYQTRMRNTARAMAIFI